MPRMHEVTPVTAPRPRYSVFGWFLRPGELYEMGGGAKGDPAKQNGKKEAVKRKKRRNEEAGGAGTRAHPCKLAQRILARAAKKAARETPPGAAV